jgi:hypothetical protein
LVCHRRLFIFRRYRTTELTTFGPGTGKMNMSDVG